MEKIPWRQLCAIARDVWKAEPAIELHEWSERIKDAIARLRLDYPRPHEITAAMKAVTHAHVKPPPPPPRAPAPAPSSPPPLTRDEAIRLRAEICKRVGVAAAPKAMPAARVLTAREADRRRALQIVAQAIRDQAAVCDRVENADEPGAADRAV